MGRTKILGKWGQAKKEKPLGNFWGIFKFLGDYCPSQRLLSFRPWLLGRGIGESIYGHTFSSSNIPCTSILFYQALKC
jgi:hypothetical protein